MLKKLLNLPWFKPLLCIILVTTTVLVLIVLYPKGLEGKPLKNNLEVKTLTTQPAVITTTPNITTASASPSATPQNKIAPINSGRSLRIPILYYHYIGGNPNPKDLARNDLSVVPDKFDAQMNYLSINGYYPITFDTFYAALKGRASLPSKPIILSFDDGYEDFYYNAYSILRKYNFHAVSFIPTGLMDQGYYLKWSQIKEMDSSGLISFQAHSVSHPNLSALSQDKLLYQLTQSKKTLETQLGKPVNFMAYPYGIGGNNPVVIQTVKQAGYLGATGTWYSDITSEGTLYNIPRIKVSGAEDITNFASRL